MSEFSDPNAASQASANKSEDPSCDSDSKRQEEALRHRTEGNEKFLAKAYLEAEECYSRAINLSNQDYLSYGNRAACKLARTFYAEALEDATESVKICDSYVKGHYRKAVALKNLGRTEEFWKVCRIAAVIAPDNDYFSLQSHLVFSEVLSIFRAEEPASPDRWMHIFTNIPDPRERLATLARFWNVASKPERLTILNRFLHLIGGPSALPNEAESHPFMAVEFMINLPLQNYNDLPKNPAWSAFFAKTEDKVAIMESM